MVGKTPVRRPSPLALGEESELQRELNIVRPVRQTKLLLNALLVRVDRFRAEEQFLTDLGRRVTLRDEAQHVALALRELLEAIALGLRRIFLREILRENPRGGGANVHVA